MNSKALTVTTIDHGYARVQVTDNYLAIDDWPGDWYVGVGQSGEAFIGRMPAVIGTGPDATITRVQVGRVLDLDGDLFRIATEQVPGGRTQDRRLCLDLVQDEYLVTFEVDEFDYATPREAAEAAAELLAGGYAHRAVYKVTSRYTGRTVEIDLSDENEED